MRFKEGDIVEIIGNSNEHHFKIGEKVRITFYDKGFYGCEDLEKSVYWYVFECDMKLIPTNSIHITTDGITATAVLKDGNKVVKQASAECSSCSTFDFQVGAKLAFEKLMDNGEVREVHRKAKVGEYVKVLYSPYDGENKGTPYVAQCVCTYHGIRGGLVFKGLGFENSREYGLSESEYIVLENYIPPKEEPTYYNGKVVCVDNEGYQNIYTVGKIYQFVDGQIIDDIGGKIPCDKYRAKSFSDFLQYTRAKWLEIVE